MENSKISLTNQQLLFVLFFLGALLFFSLGKVHLFDWDEINFAESSREMLQSGNYQQVQINFKPFWEKPPLYFWMQTLSMKLFGINEFAARFPNAICGLASVFFFVLVGKIQNRKRLGFIWGILYLGSILPFFYFKSGIIDPWFNLFIFASVFYLYLTVKNQSQKKSIGFALFSGVLAGLAILTKGPVGVLLVFLTFLFYSLISFFKEIGKWYHVVLFAISAFLVSLLWYGVELAENGIWFFNEFIDYHIRLFTTEDAGHGQPFYYHFVVVFLGCFPLSIFALKPLIKKIQVVEEKRDFHLWCRILFWVVMILFSISKTKIVHYSSLAYLPLSFLAASYVDSLIQQKKAFRKGALIFYVSFGSLLAFLFTLLPIVGMKKEQFYSYIDDEHTINSLKSNVEWGGYEWIFGLIFLTLVIASYLFLKRKQLLKGIVVGAFAMSTFLTVYMTIVVPKVEGYSQASAVEFYKSKQGEDVYVSPIGFKSYAHLFYFRIPKYTNSNYYEDNHREWLLTGNIDKPAYFVIKNTKGRNEGFQKAYPHIEFIKSDGAFSFYKRGLPQPKN